MGKLGNALYEIHHMDEMAAQNQWMNRLHPLVKLLLTIFYLTITVSFPKYSLAGLLCMGIYPIALFILGEIPFWDSLRRLPSASRSSLRAGSSPTTQNTPPWSRPALARTICPV